jgi:hypothetical protein
MVVVNAMMVLWYGWVMHLFWHPKEEWIVMKDDYEEAMKRL